MKWNTEPPKEDGYYLTTQYSPFWNKVRVHPKLFDKGEWLNNNYPRSKCYNEIIFAWSEFPKWEDEEWHEIPHYFDDRNFRDYFPKESGTYLIKGEHGWNPYTTKYVITHSLIDGEWHKYDYKKDFVYGWMDIPKPMDITDKEPIWNKEEWKNYKSSWKETQTRSTNTE